MVFIKYTTTFSVCVALLGFMYASHAVQQAVCLSVCPSHTSVCLKNSGGTPTELDSVPKCCPWFLFTIFL